MVLNDVLGSKLTTYKALYDKLSPPAGAQTILAVPTDISARVLPKVGI